MIKKNDLTFHALLIVLIITFISYYPCINNDFTTWDDSGYITKNPTIKNNSLTDYFIKDKFVMGNYHPLTMISYSIEYAFAGLDPKQYHIDNFILHLINTALAFWFIYLLVGWQIAAFVAVLFGIHPMHVESVAWISERKDVLYTFFYLSSIIFYIYYLKNNRKIFYAITFLLFLFSLLSKGQAVTLPLTLLLIDFFYAKKLNSKIIYNKIPFFILSIVFGIVAIIAQKSMNVFSSSTTSVNKIIVSDNGLFNKLIHFSNLIFERICYASYGLLEYILKLLVPINLSCFYPYPKKTDGFLPIVFYLSPIILIVLIAFIFMRYRKNKYVVFSSLFFFANIFTLLQLLPVGSSIIFDRYSYIPSIGYFFIMAQILIYFSGYKINEGKFVLTGGLQHSLMIKRVYFAVILFSISLYAYAGNKRCRVWENSETLFTNVIDNYPDVSYIQYKLGRVYFDKGEKLSQKNQVDSARIVYEKAIQHLSKSVALNPKHAIVWQGLALTHEKIGMLDLAIAEIDSAINLSSNSPELYLNRSAIYLKLNNQDSAFYDEQKAKQLEVK